MAKAPAKPEAASPGATPPKKSGKLLLIILVVALVLTLVAAGAVIVLLLLKQNKAGGGNGEAQPQAQVTEPAPAALPNAVDLSKPPPFVPLEPFTVNLHGADDRYLQTSIILRVNDPKTAESLKGFMPEIRHRINLLLSSKEPAALNSMEGREALATEILTQTNEVLGVPPMPDYPGRLPSNAPIQAVRFNSFIIQ